MTKKELQDYYDKHKNYQAGFMGLTLNVHDLIQLVREVIINSDSNTDDNGLRLDGN